MTLAVFMTLQAWKMVLLNSMTFHDFPGRVVTLHDGVEVAEPYASYLHFAPEDNTTTPAHHQSDFYGPDALSHTQPTAPKD